MMPSSWVITSLCNAIVMQYSLLIFCFKSNIYIFVQFWENREYVCLISHWWLFNILDCFSLDFLSFTSL